MMVGSKHSNGQTKPFVVCHMLTSLDGKIDGDFFASKETAPALKLYSSLRNYYDCQATIYGKTTMLTGYANGIVNDLLPLDRSIDHVDWINETGCGLHNFIVAIDPQGTLAYSSNIIEKKIVNLRMSLKY